MSPLITQTKPCPECNKLAELTTWQPQDGYDPWMRKYYCSDCGNEFYVVGGEQSAKLVVIEPQNDDPDMER